MQEHLFQSLQLVESCFPDCAVIVAGDLNRLNTKPIERHFRLKQIVKIPTRKDAILDRVLTNLHRFYDAPQGFPPFGLSDHNTITAEAKVRDNCRQQFRFVFKRTSGKVGELSLVDTFVRLIGQCYSPLQTVDHWGDVLICVLINTSAPSHWLKSVVDQLALSLNLGIFRTVSVLTQCGQTEWQ